MSSARPVIAGILAAVVLVWAVLAGSRHTPERTHSPSPTASAPRTLGPTDPRSELRFSLSLRLPGTRKLERFLRAVHDPRSPHYGAVLDARAFGARFGLPAERIARLRRRLGVAGLEVMEAYPQRTSLDMRGRAAEVSRLFNVKLRDYVDGSGRRYHRPVGRVTIPAHMRRDVLAVTGLDTRPLIRPAAAPGDGLKPADVIAAYNIKPLREAGYDGAGETVAIVSLSTSRDEDIAEFDRLTRTQGPPVQRVPVAGGTSDMEGAGEVNLDIQVIRGIAPKAQIVNYEAPNRLGIFGEVIDRIVADGRAEIVSISWGLCELFYAPEARQRDAQSFAAAQARGISIFLASGDNGAYTCERSRPRDKRPSVDWPSASPSVIAVGGTLLNVQRDGSYFDEAAWEDVVSQGGTGGGLSETQARPDWQRAPGVDNKLSNDKRQVPDVAGPADPDSGFFVINDGSATKTGGTSAAAPFWAGSTALIRQLVRTAARSRLGYLNPVLYRIAREKQRYPAFHDIQRGGNRRHNATPGWDYATGLGSPDVYNLARDLLVYYKQHPVR